MLTIINAVYLNDYKVHLTFNNNIEGIMDFQPLIVQDCRPIIQDLRDKSYFKQFNIRGDTISWSNELDFAPEFLFFQIFKDKLDYQAQFKAWGYVT